MNELILNNARNVEIYIFKKPSYFPLIIIYFYISYKIFWGAEFVEKRMKVKFDIFLT